MTSTDNVACRQKAPVTMLTSNKTILCIHGIRNMAQHTEQTYNIDWADM